MKHRHLAYPHATPVERLPAAAILDVLERGDLDDWRPLAAVIRAQPNGPLAARVLDLLDAYPMYGISPLWRAWIDRCRIRAESEPTSGDSVSLAALRRALGMTQAAAALRLKMSQSDLSKLERRRDVRLSTLRAYARALGGDIEPVFTSADGRFVVRLGADSDSTSSRRRRRKRPARR